ncbi:unnamed protein product [Schistosoma turkestanicum]|nr:unnamed protein product [Schistosoma turkestanicum]
MSHTIIGTMQTIRALGDNFCIIITEAVSTSGESFFYQNTGESIVKKESDFSPHRDDFSFSSESFNNTDNPWSCELIQRTSDQPVFKIGSSTKLIVIQAKASHILSVGFKNSEISKSKPKDVNSYLFGLDTVRSVVLSYLKNFLLTCTHGNEAAFSSNIKPGIILYGLPGCGKRTFLENIANDQTDLVPVNGSSYEKPLFVTLTSKLITELTKESSNRNGYHWLTNMIGQLDINNRSCIPVVILWPNIDKWIDHDDNTEANTHSTTDTDVESKMFPKILERLVESIQMVNQSFVHNEKVVYRFCILATATTIDKVFSIHECRELFYRRLLISLPDASKRYQILYHYINLCLSPGTDFKSSSGSSHDSTMNVQPCDIIDENESLIHVATRLHGYTPNDLVRLVHVSYATFLSKQNDNSDFSKTRNFNQSLDLFCEIMINESHSYLPINLSQHITSVEPLRWTDIGGYHELKLIFKTMIQDRLISAAKPNSLDAKADAALRLCVPRGILLHGPPGCSKTMFVRALATECQLPLIAVQASRIFGRYVGDSERNMRRILVHARASAPAILFIDEIDLLLPSRNSGETSASEHVLGEVLMAMDGVEGQNGQVILVAATNRMDNLDSALSRAGRFDLVIEVSPPDAEARIEILRLELSKRALKDKSLTNCKWLHLFATNQLINYTGAEVVQLVQHASQLARQDNSNQLCKEHLLQAQILLPPRSLSNYFSQRKTFNNEMTISTNNPMISIHHKLWIFSVLILLCIAGIFQLVYVNISKIM